MVLLKYSLTKRTLNTIHNITKNLKPGQAVTKTHSNGYFFSVEVLIITLKSKKSHPNSCGNSMKMSPQTTSRFHQNYIGFLLPGSDMLYHKLSPDYGIAAIILHN